MAIFLDGVDDVVVFSNVRDSNAGNPASFSCWFRCETDVGNQWLLGWLQSGDTAEEGKIRIQASGAIQLTHGSDSSELIQTSATGQFSYGTTWYHLVVTEDGTGNATGVKMYIDDSELTYGGTSSNHSGNRTAGDGSWCIGGRDYDTTNNFEGRLANFGYWDRVITANEITSLSKGYSPLIFRNGLLFGPDLIGSGESTDFVMDRVSGFAGALTGTANRDHPRTILPSAPQVFAAVSSGTTIEVPLGPVW